MRKSAEVVIIGGGINGCTIAYNLSKENVDVALLEKGSLANGATGRCGGMIWSNQYGLELTKVAISSGERFAELEQELDADLEYERADALTLALPGEEEDFRKAIDLQKSLGVGVEWLEPYEIRKLAPYIDVDNIPVAGGYRVFDHPANASVNPFYAVEALATNAKRLGAEIHTYTEVIGIKVKNGKIESVLTTQGEIKTYIVVNAAGGWSSDVAQMAGMKIPTMPYPHSAAALVTEPLEPLPYFPESSEIWGRQTKNGQIIAGRADYIAPETAPPTKEPGYNTEPSLDYIQHVSKIMQRYIPRLSNVNILRHWGGFFDVTPDALPILGEVDELEGLVLACGCSAHGFCFSQAVGKFITDLIVGREKSKIMERFNLRRFKREYREYPGRWFGGH
ncbi:MAG: FAD-binding oxidoreductase [Chloroflexi bacterium]|nr:FAD-binding oxidoreductase [Deltaproteobacteria bacterium]RLC62070.1 MAG: FAD-binding oxidoreductase [Chloroflexota bacterium]